MTAVVNSEKRRLQETLVAMMIETPESFENAAEIVAADGVDDLLVGRPDLSATKGMRGQFGSTQFVAVIEKFIDSAEGAGKWAGLGGVYDESILPDFVTRGMRFFLGGADTSFIMGGARARRVLQ